MQITTVSYGKTFNLGSYQSERIDVTATIEPGEDPIEVGLLLKASVLELGGDLDGVQEAQTEAAERALDRRGRVGE